MSKFKRQMGEPVTLELENSKGEKDVFTIKPLPFKYIGKLFELTKIMANAELSDNTDNLTEEEEKEASKKFLNSMPIEGYDLMVELIEKTLEISYPDVPKEERDSFGSRHLFELISKVLEVNTHGKKS